MIFRFDRYALDTDLKQVQRDQQIVPVTPKVFQLLLVLIENRHRTMSKDELLETLWPDTNVEEANLAQNISVLRRALGEQTYGKRFILTVQGQGYRFVEPIATDNEVSADSSNSSDEQNTHVSAEKPIEPLGKSAVVRPFWKKSVAALLITLVVVAVLYATGRLRENGPSEWSAISNGRSLRASTFSRLGGAEFQPTWSPDGKRIAFVFLDPATTRSGVYVKAVGALTAVRVLGGPGEFSSPSWSRDGTQLACLRMRDEQMQIVVVNTTNLTSRSVATLFPHRYGLNYRHMDWSPDGSMLVVDDKNVEAEPFSLYLIHLDSGKRIRLTYQNSDILGDVAPRFSPDGSRVAFIRLRYRYRHRAAIVSVTGGADRTLTEDSVLSDLDWNSNDSLLVAGQRQGLFDIWPLNVNSASETGKALGIQADMPIQFSVSRNGGDIAFSSYRSDLNIWSVNLRTADANAAWTPFILSPGEDIGASYSPDGSHIALRSDVSGKMGVWITNSDGSNSRMLNTGALVPATTCWSRDGKYIVFSAANSPGLYRVSITGDKPVTRLTSLHVSHPVYSADGHSIYARVGSFVYRISSEGGHEERFSDQGGAPIVPSADGKYIYFGPDSIEMPITRLDLSSRKVQPIVNDTVPGYRDAWVVRKNGIIFLAKRSGRFVLAFHDFATGKESELMPFQGGNPPVGSATFSLSPDESHLLVVRADPVSSNIRIASFGPAVR